MADLRDLLREKVESITPAPDWHEAVMRRAQRRSRRRRIEAGIVASGLVVAAMAIALRAFGNDTPAVPANQPTATAEDAGTYEFHDVEVIESSPHQAKISYWITWSTEEFPGVHRCSLRAFGENGEVVGEYTDDWSETEPPQKKDNASFGLSVTDVAVTASAECDPARLDIGHPYAHEFEVSDVRRTNAPSGDAWMIDLQTRWLGQGHPGVSECRVLILDREGESTFSPKPMVFSGELYPDLATFQWFVRDDEASPGAGPPYDARFSCRPFGSGGDYEPAPEFVDPAGHPDPGPTADVPPASSLASPDEVAATVAMQH